jgi:hypothetical protein
VRNHNRPEANIITDFHSETWTLDSDKSPIIEHPDPHEPRLLNLLQHFISGGTKFAEIKQIATMFKPKFTPAQLKERLEEKNKANSHNEKPALVPASEKIVKPENKKTKNEKQEPAVVKFRLTLA